MSRKTQALAAGCLLVGLSLLMLAGCSGQTSALPIDGDRLSAYSATYTADSEQGGALSLQTSQDDRGNWLINSTLTAPNGSMQSRVSLQGDFTPESTRIELSAEGQAYVIQSEYGEKQLVMQAETPSGPQSAERNLRRPYYDNEQLVAMLPALKLEPGKQLKFVLVATQSATKLTPSITLVAEDGQPLVEQVAVPSGTVDCHLIRFNAGVANSSEQTFWVTTSAPYVVAKIDNGTVTYTLTELK